MKESWKMLKMDWFAWKGGDLTQEVFDAGLRPQIFDIKTIFKQDFFDTKFIVYVPL